MNKSFAIITIAKLPDDMVFEITQLDNAVYIRGRSHIMSGGFTDAACVGIQAQEVCQEFDIKGSYMRLQCEYEALKRKHEELTKDPPVRLVPDQKTVTELRERLATVTEKQRDSEHLIDMAISWFLAAPSGDVPLYEQPFRKTVREYIEKHESYVVAKV